mmetsp:Transcript_88317/g.142897  ORF Transcript_88317/g.142897 Transcript_88317/m.142897 type:complete len:81 (+) Transcript_88317:66-308(+)
MDISVVVAGGGVDIEKTAYATDSWWVELKTSLELLPQGMSCLVCLHLHQTSSLVASDLFSCSLRPLVLLPAYPTDCHLLP